MVVDCLQGLSNKIWAKNTKEHGIFVVNEDIPRYVKPLDDIYSKSDGPFLLGSELSIPDIKLFGLLSFISGGVLGHIPTDTLDGFFHLLTASRAVENNEKIAEWIAAHKK